MLSHMLSNRFNLYWTYNIALTQNGTHSLHSSLGCYVTWPIIQLHLFNFLKLLDDPISVEWREMEWSSHSWADSQDHVFTPGYQEQTGCSVPTETAANCRFQTWLTSDRPSAETPGYHTRESAEWYDCYSFVLQVREELCQVKTLGDVTFSLRPG